MIPRLPPPDPYESYDLALTGGRRATAPTALFVMGTVSPQADRVADRVLEMRPGVLVVVSRD